MMKSRSVTGLDEVRSGMTLAEPVVDANGQMLVPAGTVLTESLLAGLQRRGVTVLTVEQEIEEDVAEREARRLRLSQHLERIFRKAGEGRATREIRAVVLAYRLEEGA